MPAREHQLTAFMTNEPVFKKQKKLREEKQKLTFKIEKHL